MTDHFWTCEHCNRAWPHDPELEEKRLYCPECGEPVRLVVMMTLRIADPAEVSDV